MEAKLRDFQVRDGRARNEKGYYERRIKELEQLALSNSASTGQPDYGQPDATSHYQPAYQPQPAPPQADIVTRDEFDLYRFQRDHSDRFDAVRAVAMDGNKVGNFIRYRVDSWGRPMIGADGRAVGDIYSTYAAIASHLENEELRAKLSQSSPGRNPALGTISGTASASQAENVDLTDKSPEDIKKMYPELFPDSSGNAFSPWSK